MSRVYRYRAPTTRRSGRGGLVALVVVVAIAAALPDSPPAATAAPAGDAGGITPVGQRTSGAGVDGAPGTFDDYVGALAPDMQVAVRQLDAAMGGGLRIVSGYRSAGYQEQLCRRVAGPCAPPGRSLHQHGLAIDTPDWQRAVTALAAHPEIALCQPLPGSDANHLSHHTGSEC